MGSMSYNKTVTALPLIGTGLGAVYGGVRGALQKPRELTKTNLKRFENEDDKSYDSRVKRSISLKKRYIEKDRKGELTGSIAGGALQGLSLGFMAKYLIRLRDSIKNYNHHYSGSSYGGYKNYGGSSYGGYKNYGGSSYSSAFKSSAKRHPEADNLASILKKAKTKAEAKTAYRKSSIKVHPDKGGSNEAFTSVNDEWNRFYKSPSFSKLAYLMFFKNK